MIASALRTPTLLALFSLASAPALIGADFILNIVDPPGVGFNDLSPAVTPAPGNPGRTLGEQRVEVMKRAFQVWGAKLRSDVPIVVQAAWFPLACNPTSGVLAGAGTIQIFALPPSPLPVLADVWYHSALIQSLIGLDITPGPPDPGFLEPPFNDDIVVQINLAIDADPNCLGGVGFYYGLDRNEGPKVDLFSTLLHELAHGLGFSNFVNETNGEEPLDLPDIYEFFTLDTEKLLFWPQMTPAERVASATNDPYVVWAGPTVNAVAPTILATAPVLMVDSPPAIQGEYAMQPAQFGPPADGLSAEVALADDGVGATSDGCEGRLTGDGPWPGAAAVAGKIALIDRGGCSFVIKTLNAQLEGAIGVIIANNLPSGLPPMGDDGNGGFVTIPSCGVEQSTGDLIKTALPGVQVTKRLEGSRLAGVDPIFGLVRLHAPDPLQPGSSISHWTSDAVPDLLMEPVINRSLADTLDLTVPLFVDEGWIINPPADLTGDGIVDALDFDAFQATYGKCAGDVGYRSEADYDGDRCVLLADYRIWYQAFASN